MTEQAVTVPRPGDVERRRPRRLDPVLVRGLHLTMSVSAPQAAVRRSTVLPVLRGHGDTLALAALWVALVLATP
ncbi:hypothetical protein ABZ647_01220 [Micromonospora aurantiaca]|uniref:hypothetical protein n=1 Tax=Micromonospora TaxID=1873 RepID=UPI000A8DE93F|nr:MULTISPECIES: hypothetical protein [Micromonospora]